MCPRQGSNFLLLRQKKVTKEKASRIRRPSAYAAGTLRCSGPAGSAETRLAPQTSALLDPPLPALLASSLRRGEPNTKTTRTRHGASLWSLVVGSGCRLLGSLCRVAGLSSAAAGGSGRALFERSEFSPTPPDASSARYPAGALTSARLLFAYFLLAKQEKVSALPGAHPGNATSTNT